MVVNSNYFNNINKIPGIQPNTTPQKPSQQQGDFEKILQDRLQRNSEIKFSKHAELRLQARNINVTPAIKEKISNAVNKAEQKGVKDSLVMVDNVAYVVNVKNRTIITAVNSNELKDNVFTNIDGAVFG